MSSSSPMPPPLTQQFATEVIAIEQNQHSNNNSSNVKSSKSSISSSRQSSAFFKPAGNTRKDRGDADRRNREHLRSPVLGTEALYRQAGWMTPLQHQHDYESREEEKEKVAAVEEEKEKMVVIGNRLEHSSFEAGGRDDNKITTQEAIDLQGLQVSNREARDKPNNTTFNNVSCESDLQQHDTIPADELDQNEAGCGTDPEQNEANGEADTDEDDAGGEADDENNVGKDDDEDDEEDGDEDIDDDDDEDDDEETEQKENPAHNNNGFKIPRSMREIYKISNRNRRNKKLASPVSAPSDAPQEAPKNELAKAELLLKSRGIHYFDDLPPLPKQQHSKSVGTSASLSSEEAGTGGGGDSSNSLLSLRDDDVAYMQDIGWFKSKDEVQSMLTQSQQQRKLGTNEDGAMEEDREDDNNTNSNNSITNTSTSGSTNTNNIGDTKEGKVTQYEYSAVANAPIGEVTASDPVSNPFLVPPTTSGNVSQQFGKSERKKMSNTNSVGNNNSGRPKGKGRSQTFKNKR